MDIKNIIDIAVRQVLNGVDEAKKSLKGVAGINHPTRVDIEFGINGSYEPADYTETHMAKVRFSVPIYSVGEEGESPATDALEKPKGKGKK